MTVATVTIPVLLSSPPAGAHEMSKSANDIITRERRALDARDGDGQVTAGGLSARLLNGELAPLWRLRLAMGVLGGVVLPLVAVAVASSVLVAVALGALIIGELVERHLFFVAGVTRGMPGGVRA